MTPTDYDEIANGIDIVMQYAASKK